MTGLKHVPRRLYQEMISVAFDGGNRIECESIEEWRAGDARACVNQMCLRRLLIDSTATAIWWFAFQLVAPNVKRAVRDLFATAETPLMHDWALHDDTLYFSKERRNVQLCLYDSTRFQSAIVRQSPVCVRHSCWIPNKRKSRSSLQTKRRETERQRDEWIENRTMTRNVVPTFIVSHGEWIRRAERDAESAWMDIRTYWCYCLLPISNKRNYYH